MRVKSYSPAKIQLREGRVRLFQIELLEVAETIPIVRVFGLQPNCQFETLCGFLFRGLLRDCCPHPKIRKHNGDYKGRNHN
jgi:hypothetical protein